MWLVGVSKGPIVSHDELVSQSHCGIGFEHFVASRGQDVAGTQQIVSLVIGVMEHEPACMADGSFVGVACQKIGPRDSVAVRSSANPAGFEIGTV